jgi:hypothetical protein
MLHTLLLVACISAFVCWAIGVYNRLVRLRSKAIESHKIFQNFLLDKPIVDDSYVQDVQLEVKIQISENAYDAAVSLYNRAIKQFPARYIATLFGFKPHINNIGKPE